MSNKAEIRMKISQKENEKSGKQSELSGLREDLKRLKEALKGVKSAQDDFNSAHSKYNNTKIADSDWKGKPDQRATNIKRTWTRK